MGYGVALVVILAVAILVFYIEARCDHRFKGPFEDEQGKKYIRCFSCAKRIDINL